MEKFEDMAFRRGMLLSNLDEGYIRSKLNESLFPQLSAWKKTYFGPSLKFWYDTRLNMSRNDTPRFSVALLGLAINPYDGVQSNNEIVQILLDRLTHSYAAFRDYVDELTGSFLILMRDGDSVYLQQDAAATKTLYYRVDAGGHISAAVHAPIVAALHGLGRDPYAEKTWKSESYLKDPSRYLPGLVTEFSNLLPLTANTELDFTLRRPRRIFPREPLASRDFGDSLTLDVANTFKRQADMIMSLGRPVYLAATGGRDSRMSYAAFSQHAKLRLFSFHYPSSNHLTEDVRIATKLAKLSEHELIVFDLERRDDEKKYFAKAFQLHSPRGIWLDAAYSFAQNFEDNAIHVRSTVSEIGRIFYRHRWAKNITGQNFVTTYSKHHAEPWVVAELDRFFEFTGFNSKNLLNYDPYDMFYWEHRNSKWQNILCVEAEMACDVFIPYNNRRLLKSMMSIPYEDRENAELHMAVIKQIRPDFAAVEIA